MAHIPPGLLKRSKPIPGLIFRGNGKVRNSYDLPNFINLIAVEASDRISVFDHVLPATIPQKGEILTAINHFWNGHLTELFRTDFVAAGTDIDSSLPEEIRGNPEIQARTTIVRKYHSPEEEDIVRLILTGSGWTSYQENGTVCGHKLPKGLWDGAMLPYPIYTPSTKAKEGHDEPLDYRDVVKKYGSDRERVALQATQYMNSIAKARRILLGDDKKEIVIIDGQIIIIDEKGTPDSSRYYDLDEKEEAAKLKKLPDPLDKQFTRNWAIQMGIKKLDPKKAGNREMVWAITVPKNIIRDTAAIYRYTFWRLTGMKLEKYQREQMGIKVKDKKIKIAVAVQNEADVAKITPQLGKDGEGVEFNVDVVPAAKGLEHICNFVATVNADVIIAAASGSPTLPYGIKFQLRQIHKGHIPVLGVVMDSDKSSADDASALVLECLPDQAVELNMEKRAYRDVEGFFRACSAAIHSEFRPRPS